MKKGCARGLCKFVWGLCKSFWGVLSGIKFWGDASDDSLISMIFFSAWEGRKGIPGGVVQGCAGNTFVGNSFG